MSSSAQDPLETILRLCAAAAPDPWYPRLYSRKHHVDPVTMDSLLEELWLEGLIEKAGSDPEAGPGVVLTERGRWVLQDPAALQRLRDGRPLAEDDRGAIVRQVVRAPARPVMTRLVILANLAVFAYGIYLAWNIPLVREYVSGMPLFGGKVKLDPRVFRVWQACGSVTGRDYIQGQWWRLLTAEWVHFGLLHLLLNMLGLYLVGRATEAMWGRVRYLAIYLLSAWASVCVALATLPEGAAGAAVPVAGASGAVCGLMGAEAVWVLCNGRHLPRALRRRARVGIFVNFLLVAFIGLSAGVSGWGHFGGAAAGAAAALLLHVQRFGPRALRWPAAAAVVLVPAVAFAYLEYTLSDELFEGRYLSRINKLTGEAHRFYQKEVRPLLDQHPTRRDAHAVDDLLPRIDSMRSRLSELAAALQKAGPRHDPDVEKGRQAALAYVAALAELHEQTARCLRAGEGWTHREEKARLAQAARVEQERAAWEDRLEPADPAAK